MGFPHTGPTYAVDYEPQAGPILLASWVAYEGDPKKGRKGGPQPPPLGSTEVAENYAASATGEQ